MQKLYRVPPLFFMKIFVKIFILFMGSEDKLGVEISIPVPISSIGSTVKFLSTIREICFQKIVKICSFVEIFLNMLLTFAMINCP